MLSKFVGCRMVGKARQVRAPWRPVQGQPDNFDKSIFEELGVNKLKVFVLQREVVIPADAEDALRRGFREPGVHIGERLEVLVLETAEISAMNEDVAVGNLHRAMGAMRIRNDAERGHGLRSWRGKVLPRPT